MSTTRLLVLGIVAAHERAHGYLVHHELVEVMGADEWANVKWGSIYHALKQLAKEGKLESLPPEGGIGRVDYRVTPAGETAFYELLREALSSAAAHDDFLSAGLAFLSAVPRIEAIDLLEQRLATLEADRDELAPYVDTFDEWTEPGTEHVPELFGLWHHNAESSITWTRGILARLRAGHYTMEGDRPGSDTTS